MSHISGLDNKKVKAEFHFVCVNSSKLTREAVHQSILNIIDLTGALQAEQELYTQYVAFVQDDGLVVDSGKPLQKWDYGLKGEHHRLPFSAVSKILSLKYDHEAQHLRYEGHQSTVAPSFLTRNTLAIIIGDREFLATNACLYMERTGLLRQELIPMLIAIAGLRERKSRMGDSYIRCSVFHEAFYPGNFDALLEEVRKTRRTTAELASLLEEKGY